MRIGITCYPTYGGSGVVATELGIELAALGHEVHFISYSQPFRLSGRDEVHYNSNKDVAAPPGFENVAKAVGVPLAHYPASTHPATPGGFVYFDLPGISLRNPGDNAALAAFLDREAITQRILVLNAAYDHVALRAAYTAGCDLGAQ